MTQNDPALQWNPHKVIFGSLAGVLAASSLQPLENVKMVLMIPPKGFRLTNNIFFNLFNSAKYLV